MLSGLMSMANKQGPLLDAQALVRGVTRLLSDMGFSGLSEFRLGNGRRADVAALGPKGEITIVEIKCALADFRADRKWPDYLAYCDRFYFAVPPDLPRGPFEADDCRPDRTGLIIADGFGGAIVREAAHYPISAARRRAETIRFARMAASRLTHNQPSSDNTNRLSSMNSLRNIKL